MSRVENLLMWYGYHGIWYLYSSKKSPHHPLPIDVERERATVGQAVLADLLSLSLHLPGRGFLQQETLTVTPLHTHTQGQSFHEDAFCIDRGRRSEKVHPLEQTKRPPSFDPQCRQKPEHIANTLNWF